MKKQKDKPAKTSAKIDKYALSLADKNHKWTNEERRLYEIATEKKTVTKPVKFYPTRIG